VFYRLPDKVRVVIVDEKLFLVDDDIYELDVASTAVGCAVQTLKNGCTQKHLHHLLGEEQSRQLVTGLKNAKLIRTKPLVMGEGPHATQRLYFDDFDCDVDEVDRRLRTSTVVIIGMGGVGSIVLEHLLGAGVERYILIDGDIVRLTNLNRQYIYTPSVVGEQKVEAASAYVKNANQKAVVTTYNQYVRGRGDLEALDNHDIRVIVNAADEPPGLEKVVGTYCTQRRLAYISCAVGRQTGTWGPLTVPGKTRCLNCFLHDEQAEMSVMEKRIRSSLEAPIKASFGPTNSVIASLMAKDLIVYLGVGCSVPSLGTRVSFDFRTLTTATFAPKCTGTCQCWNHARG